MSRPMWFVLFFGFTIVAGLASSAGTTAARAAASSSAGPLANGRSIFETGRDSQGARIVAKPAAMYPNCAACHRMNGSGGVHLPGRAVSADLRYTAMVTDQKRGKMRPYTVALIERAVSIGIDNAGKPLDPVMPRWKMSARDLHDVALYVSTKLK